MKGVLWDLDDTVLETLPGRMRALEHAYETCLGSKTDPEALWRSHRGGTLEDLGRRLVGDDYLRFAKVYRDFYYGQPRSIRAFDGVREVLEVCVEHGLPMAVVTSKVSWGATEELAQAGMLQFFQAVVGFDDSELHKPDAEPMFVAMERLLLDDAEDLVYVGDSPADVWSARNAGVVSVAALWGTLDRELLLDAMPDHVATAPEDVLRVLAGSEAAR